MYRAAFIGVLLGSIGFAFLTAAIPHPPPAKAYMLARTNTQVHQRMITIYEKQSVCLSQKAQWEKISGDFFDCIALR